MRESFHRFLQIDALLVISVLLPGRSQHSLLLAGRVVSKLTPSIAESGSLAAADHTASGRTFLTSTQDRAVESARLIDAAVKCFPY